MSKQWIFNIITVALVILCFIFWAYSYANLKAENSNLKTDNDTLRGQITTIQEAALLRQAEYEKIEIEYNKLNNNLEELKDDESKTWLNGSIPVTVDNTIPY